MSTGYGYVQDGTYTGGWAGSEASRERAERDERTGRGKNRREAVLNYIRLGGLDGRTVAEVREHFNMHHGTASSALSNLHKAGRIVRLREHRNGCSIYVQRVAVNGRETRAQGWSKRSTTSGSDPVERVVEVYVGPTEDQILVKVEEAYSDGRDAGWKEGYESALKIAEAAISESDVKQEGIREGRRIGAYDAARSISEIASAMAERIPKRVSSHHKTCWALHPECAVRVIALSADRIAKENVKE